MRTKHSAQAPRLLMLLAAFLCGLFLIFGAVILVTGSALSPIGQAVAAIGGPLDLQDQNGKPFSDAQMRGEPFLVFFGFTHCPDICPTTLFDMSQMMKALGPDAGRAGVLFITVDPERDTAPVLKDYLSNFDQHLRGLTGSRAQINAAIKEYRVYAKKVPLENGDYTMDHTAMVYLMDKDGRFVTPFNMKRTPEAEAADLRRYM
ncbi:MAG TPA: SCO family protein [Xanthobacteraceae bacterium]|jgi:protein SCO1/2|nr:SCO family protein [Xanthobacteraceae bacterium]